MKNKNKFEKYFVRRGRCQRCGFLWPEKHSNNEMAYCISIVSYELAKFDD
jgi:hypothetical protein